MGGRGGGAFYYYYYYYYHYLHEDNHGQWFVLSQYNARPRGIMLGVHSRKFLCFSFQTTCIIVNVPIVRTAATFRTACVQLSLATI